MLASLLLAALAAPALAAPPAPPADKVPDCIHVSSTSLRFKPDLDAVRDCQDAARRRLIADAEAKGKPLSYQRIEKIDDAQRAEVKAYLEKSGTVIEGATKSDRALDAGGKERRGFSPEESAEIGALEKRLRDAAGAGKDGITPAMGRDILDSLEKKQGFVSPDMKDLLDAVVRDGGKLTPETMKKLQSAGRAAKGEGLDLKIDPGMEKELLERDFDKDKDAPPAMPDAPGNL